MSLVAIEARALSGPAAGVVRYLRGLVPALRCAAPELPILLFTDHPRGARVFPGLPSRVVPPSAELLRWYWDFLALPAAVRRSRAALLHRTKPAGTPFRRGLPPTITTIYDVIPLDFPETQTLTQRTYWRVQLPLAARSAAHVLTISEASRQRIHERLGVPRDRITVTYPGVDPAFKRAAAEAVAEMRARLGLEAPYVLTVGTIEPRKNVDRLLRSFAEASHSIPHTLVVAGRWGWKTGAVRAALRDPRLEGRVRMLGAVAAEHLPTLYSGAEMFVTLSRAEGFGFPALEAMACGAPVIVSNRGSLPETVGEAALVVDSEDRTAVATAIVRFAEDRTRREEFSRRGQQRAKAFTWDQTAAGTLRVYKQFLGS